MDILENELVRKYFRCGCHSFSCRNDLGGVAVGHTSRDLLRAMQEPINKGEKYLKINEDGIAKECVYDESIGFLAKWGYHGYQLRLPDRFQPAKKECGHAGFAYFCGVCKKRVELVEKPPSAEGCDELRHQMGYQLCPNCPNKSDTAKCDSVEQKIKEISGWFQSGADNRFKIMLCIGLEDTLRELVELARKS